MTSNPVRNENSELEIWLRSNANNFLDLEDRVDSVIVLKNTIKNDPRAQELGIKFDHRFEIQPKAIFTVQSVNGESNFGLIEISTSAAGLKDVGILHAYAKMVRPKYAILLCKKSFSKELTYLLTDPIIGPRLLSYSEERSLKLLNFS